MWQSPANDWGDRPGGWDLRGAKELVFWARGAEGGEVVKFEYGILGRDKPYFDTARGDPQAITLTREWKRHVFPLAGKDLSRIKTGFSLAFAGQGRPFTFYLDDIRWVAGE